MMDKLGTCLYSKRPHKFGGETWCKDWTPQAVEIDVENIDDYGRYTVQRWFSAGEEADRLKENYAERGAGTSLTIMTMGLSGEVGEVTEHIKKLYRDGKLDKDALKKELGDVQFYLTRLMKYFGWEPSDVIAVNVDKLEGRVSRGTMRGNGDNR